MHEIIVHTDGGCSGNPGPGAWAYVMRYGDRLREDSGYEADTTNNKMELQAVIEALSFLAERRRNAPRNASWISSPITVYTDSQYVKNGISLWISGWKSRNWLTTNKKCVKNKDLWEQLDRLVEDVSPSFHWVEGHAGNIDNERCDTLVRAMMKSRMKPNGSENESDLPLQV
jgi:ribonuclease HI